MRKIKMDLGELIYAFEDTSWEANRYLDVETGQVVTITGETRRELERIYEEYDPEEQPFDLAEILQKRDLPEWHQQMLLEADQIEAYYGSRYIGVPQADSHEGYRDMEAFIVTVEDERLQDQLWRAISGRGAFRRFKDVLANHFHERERWFSFQDTQLKQRVLDWLESEGIEPIIEPSAEETGPPIPSERARLIAEVLPFVRAASKLPGVLRIVLIGSLVTDEPDPKDVDMLVTVTDDADLAPLATLGRKLQGHAQGFNRGGEVFLADPQGNYLGRTCSWKRCGPGIRMSCDALHCGRRHYLHDDLKAICLRSSGNLILKCRTHLNFYKKPYFESDVKVHKKNRNCYLCRPNSHFCAENRPPRLYTASFATLLPAQFRSARIVFGY
jgi:predicted nucleotidyltransferase